LGRGSWIAAHAVATKGVRIGRGALLAANSVATANVPDFTVAGGVPARTIKKKSRFDIAI
jgi:acetyltransferase-like isoleucine patch superfamily enzyme